MFENVSILNSLSARQVKSFVWETLKLNIVFVAKDKGWQKRTEDINGSLKLPSFSQSLPLPLYWYEKEELTVVSVNLDMLINC